MEKKSSIKEVYKLVPDDYPTLYQKLSKVLGDANPFAKFSIGSGYYIWSDNRCNWHQMIAWSSYKQEAVKEALSTLRANLISKIGEKTTDVLLSIPDDGYLYFNDDEGDIKVLITGWGFKKPVRVSGEPHVEELVQKLPITLAFYYDGSKLPNYPFAIKLGHAVRKLHTGADGIWSVPDLGVGEKFLIYDLQNNNQTYSLEIVSGQFHYGIDLTQYTVVTIHAVADEQPVVNEQVVLQYHDTPYWVVTDANGKAELEIPLYEAEKLTAQLREQTKEIRIQPNNNYVDFVFETEPPVVNTEILVTVLSNGNVCPDADVTVDYDGQTYQGLTDEKGQYVLKVQVNNNQICNVGVVGYDSQCKALTDAPIHEFIFDKNITPPPPPSPAPAPSPCMVTPALVVQYESGDLLPDYPVTVEINGHRGSYLTDSNGKIVLDEVPAGELMTVVDGRDSSHAEEYELTEDQDEYLFIIPDEEEVPDQELKIMFRTVDGKPISCNEVTFRQEGLTDITTTLDEDGDVYLPANTFKTGKKVTASVKGWEDKYDPIPFEVLEDEYEYLLQEKEATSSWSKLLLQFLALFVTIAVVMLLWPFIENIAAEIYESIYHVACPYLN